MVPFIKKGRGVLFFLLSNKKSHLIKKEDGIMTVDLRFLATKETKAFFESIGLTDQIKENSSGICELKASAANKIHAIVELIDEADAIGAIEERISEIIYACLEKVEKGGYIDVKVTCRPNESDSRLEVRAELSAGDSEQSYRYSIPVESVKPKDSLKLSKFFPIADILINENSPLFSSEIESKMVNFTIAEAAFKLVKKSAEFSKDIKKVAKDVLDKYDPKTNSIVDLIVQGEKDVVALVKKSVNIAKPIEFEVTRQQITGGKNINGRGYRSIISFQAGGKAAHYIIAAIHQPSNYRNHGVMLLAVVVTGLPDGREDQYLEEKWETEAFPGRSEEEFKKIMCNNGLRTAKGGAEKKYNDLSRMLDAFKIEQHDDKFVAILNKQEELKEPGRGDQMNMDDSVHKTIETSMKEIVVLAKKLGAAVNMDVGYSEIDYYDGCDSYSIPRFIIKNNTYSDSYQTSNDTPKGWYADFFVKIEIPTAAKIDTIHEIMDRVRTVMRVAKDPNPRRSYWLGR